MCVNLTVMCVRADTAVADVALNILCLLMKDQWSWLCTENIQKTIRLLFGTFIERYHTISYRHLHRLEQESRPYPSLIID